MRRGGETRDSDGTSFTLPVAHFVYTISAVSLSNRIPDMLYADKIDDSSLLNGLQALPQWREYVQ